MATTSFAALRRFAGIVFALILFNLCLTGAALGQAPLVTVSAPVGLTHPSGWGSIQQTAIDSNGNWLLMDYSKGGLYEFPAGGAAVITPVPQGTMLGGGNPGMLLDPANNLYLGGIDTNIGCLLEYPYGSATARWPILTQTLGLGPKGNVPATYAGVTSNTAAGYCNYEYSGTAFTTVPTAPAFAEGAAYIPLSAGYFLPAGLAVNQGPSGPSLVVGTQNGGNGIFSLPVTLSAAGVWSTPVADCTSGCSNTTPSSALVSTLTAPAISIAVDPNGNIYFVEASGGLPGVYEIPSGTSGIPSDSGLVRVDPSLPNVTGVITDAAGNLYISDGTEGVFMVPAAPNAGGSPATSASVLLTPVPAQGQVAIDPARKLLDVPTTQSQNNGLADVAMVGMGYAEFGASPVGTAATAVPVDFSFSGSVTPASFAIVEAGMAAPEFAITAYSSTSAAPNGYCASTTTTGPAKTPTTYTAQQSCFVSVIYTPSGAGNGSARLLMLDAKQNILASMVLHGTGTGAIGQVSPSPEVTVGSTLQTPTQMTTDALGNVYVADPGLGKVLEYPAGSNTPVPLGTSLIQPTGVAVDGAGDVFIADSGNGTVYEIPFGPTGLNAAGQVTLKSGFGTSGLNLAADGLGNLYVADPSKGQVVKLASIGNYADGALAPSVITLTTGFTAPSAVAVDSNNNLYIVDGAKLLELAGGVSGPITSLTPTTAPTTPVTGLSGVTGLATDPSGSVYISSTAGTFKIPLSRGALKIASKTPVASDVTSSSSVALDRMGNIYVTPSSGPGIRMVSANGAFTFTLTAPATSTTQTATITNIGNGPLLVNTYNDFVTNDYGLNVTNFTGADGTCVSSSTKPNTGVAAGGTCTVNVTYSPGIGQSGSQTGWVQAVGNAANNPITINTTGTGPTLLDSGVQVTVGSNPEVVNTPVTVTVTPASGTVNPTGTVQAIYTSWNVVVPNCAQAPCAPQVNPITVTQLATLTPVANSSASTATFPNLAPVLAGTQTITVGYQGDPNRVYATTSGNASTKIAQSQITWIADPKPPTYLPFTQESNSAGGKAPYDGTATNWSYSMPLTVGTAAGVPTGTLTFNDDSSTCPPGTSANGVGAAVCQLASYKGVACPETSNATSGVGVQYILNNGSSVTGATATFATSCLQMPSFTSYTPVVSTHYITPVYSGDQNFIGATDPVSSVFQALRSSEVSIGTSIPNNPAAPPVPTAAGSLTVKAGSTASLSLYVTPLLGYGFEGKGGSQINSNFPVSLTCDNLPPHATCSFTYPTTVSPYQPSAPNSVQVCPQPNLDTNAGTAAAYEALAESGGCNANGVGAVTLTINTNVPDGTTVSRNASGTSFTLASIFGLGMIGLFFRRRAFEKAGRALMIVLMIVAAAFSVSLTACSTTDLTPQSQAATPTGTYAVSITAVQVGYQCVPEAGATSPCTTGTGAAGQQVYGSNNPDSLPYYVNVTVQ